MEDAGSVEPGQQFRGGGGAALVENGVGDVGEVVGGSVAALAAERA